MATTDTSKDDSGLHDLKALASSAKRRRNKRRTTQMEAQDSLLASTAALEAVVLPDPRKSVAMPVVKIDVETPTGAAKTVAAKTVTSTAKTSASVETSVATELAAPPEDSKGSKVGLIAVVGVVGVAAAAFVLFGGKGDSDKQAEAGTPVKTPVAQVDTAAPDTATSGTEAADTGNQPGSDTEPTLVAVAVPEIDPGQEASGDGSNGSEIAGKEDPTALVAEETKPEEAVKDKKPARILTDEEKAEAKLKREERLAAKKIAKEEAAAAKAAKAKDSKIGKDKSLSNGDSLDDVLSSVTGGLDKQVVKKDTKPTKTSLGRSDVKKAMKKVAGRAKSCYSQEEFSGMVTVKYAVKPDGSLSNVKATGSHAGSKTGKCVVKAVKTAKFPAYSGSPMTFTYPFMLSP
ncbi:MAG: AgmX/PglI C-terminal domain-containing protein [Kofleriaceae bacterium]|nr:AgmX/PglI C-terminal domain-containing protein [Kofleriaceae bacterium]